MWELLLFVVLAFNAVILYWLLRGVFLLASELWLFLVQTEPTLTRPCRQRRRKRALEKDLEQLLHQKDGISAQTGGLVRVLRTPLPNDKPFGLEVAIQGPPGSPYSEGIFVVHLSVGDEYPLQPPKVRFLTPIWHPNVGRVNGAVYLDVLTHKKWSPAWNLSSLLMAIFSILSDPLAEAVTTDAATCYRENPELYFKAARSHTRIHAAPTLPRQREEEEKAIESLMELGFGRESVQQALEWKEWNVDDAASALLAAKMDNARQQQEEEEEKKKIQSQSLMELGFWREKKIQSLMEMGFGRESARQALEWKQWNVDEASLALLVATMDNAVLGLQYEHEEHPGNVPSSNNVEDNSQEEGASTTITKQDALFLQQEEEEKKVQSLMELGFGRESAQQALEWKELNVEEAAVALLVSGVDNAALGLQYDHEEGHPPNDKIEDNSKGEVAPPTITNQDALYLINDKDGLEEEITQGFPSGQWDQKTKNHLQHDWKSQQPLFLEEETTSAADDHHHPSIAPKPNVVEITETPGPNKTPLPSKGEYLVETVDDDNENTITNEDAVDMIANFHHQRSSAPEGPTRIGVYAKALAPGSALKNASQIFEHTSFKMDHSYHMDLNSEEEMDQICPSVQWNNKEKGAEGHPQEDCQEKQEEEASTPDHEGLEEQEMDQGFPSVQWSRKEGDLHAEEHNDQVDLHEEKLPVLEEKSSNGSKEYHNEDLKDEDLHAEEHNDQVDPHEEKQPVLEEKSSNGSKEYHNGDLKDEDLHAEGHNDQVDLHEEKQPVLEEASSNSSKEYHKEDLKDEHSVLEEEAPAGHCQEDFEEEEDMDQVHPTILRSRDSGVDAHYEDFQGNDFLSAEETSAAGSFSSYSMVEGASQQNSDEDASWEQGFVETND